MFYNKRKTIGVFLNRAELEFQQVLSRSLTETMYDLYKEKKVKKARR